jgi:glucose/mannose-6-phosphate isomerase
MILDDYLDFRKIDAGDMYAHIEGLPDQLLSAWELGKKQPLSIKGEIKSIIVAGMGGSAIGADLAAAYLSPHCVAPIIVHRDYGLPAWAKGPETLMIASSHSGNTEETLSVFDQALKNGCQVVAITRGGKLADLGDTSGAPVWRFKHDGMPRAAVGFSFGLLVALISRLGLTPGLTPDIHAVVKLMLEQRETLKKEKPISQNPAKSLAVKLESRFVSVVGSDYLAPVARRWKGQMNELAKANANFEYLPEMDHNTLAGVNFPFDLLHSWIVVFLQASSDHPRNRLRSDITLHGLKVRGISADHVIAAGNTPLDHLWSMIQMGDYVAYYLAMLYEIDPTPIAAIEDLKQAMKGI